MAFLDKLGQVANKVGEVAGDTFDYGKAKGKIVMEKGKIKDLKEEMGDYIYNTLKSCEALDMDILNVMCAKIDEHLANIAQYEDDATVSGANISDAVSVAVNEVKNTVTGGAADDAADAIYEASPVEEPVDAEACDCKCNEACECDGDGEEECCCDGEGCGCDDEGCGCDDEDCGCDGEGCGCDGGEKCECEAEAKDGE